MTPGDDLPDEDLESESSRLKIRLKDGLQSCRNIVTNYRALLKDSNDLPADPKIEDEPRGG